MMKLNDYFPQLEDDLVEEIEKKAVFKTFKAGDVIMRTGQYIKSTMLVLSGRLKIYRENAEDGEFLMYYLEGGQACAVSMMCAIQAKTSEVMAKAEEDTDVLMLPIEMMDDFLTRYKSWYQFVIQTYRSRFDELLTVVDNIAFRNMDERLGFYLKRYAEKTNSIHLEVSHQQIADDLNSSREVISRLLKKMEQNKRVKLHRNMIELVQQQ